MTLPTVNETGPFQIVGCVFRQGDKRAYGYKIPASWEPKIGQRLKVRDSRGTDDAWKAVIITELNQSLNPAIRYAWGLELMEDEGEPKIAPQEQASIADRFQPSVTPAYDSRFTPDRQNVGADLIGNALRGAQGAAGTAATPQTSEDAGNTSKAAPDAPTGDFGSW